jgi:hypothetical protein
MYSNDPRRAAVRAVAASGRLAAITSHGELERPDTCVVGITPGQRADPLDASAAVAS